MYEVNLFLFISYIQICCLGSYKNFGEGFHNNGPRKLLLLSNFFGAYGSTFTNPNP